MKLKVRTCSGFAFTSMALALGLVSQTYADEKTNKLPTVEVTARQIQDKVINSATLQRQQASSMRDIFNTDPSVNIGGGGVNAQRIYLNGVEGTNLNITIDGARQGRSLFQHRGGLTGIDPALLKRVEAKTSGGQQGPGALGGSIKFETVDAQDLLNEGRAAGARVRAGYASADSSKQGGVSVYGKVGDKLGLLVHAAAADRDDYRTGGGDEVLRSASDDRDYFIKVSLLDVGDHQVRLSLNNHESSGIYARGSNGSDAGILPDPLPTSGPSVPVSQKVDRKSYSLDHRYQPTSPWLDWRANVYLSENEVSYPGSTATPISTEEQGFALSNSVLFEQANWWFKTTLGLDYLSEDGKTSDFKVNSKNLGAYLQNELSWQDFTFNLGARFDDYSADYRHLELDDSDISPNFGVNYAITPELSVFASYEEAVRATGIVPVGWLSRMSEATLQNNGQRSLESEKSEKQEVGVNYLSKGVFAADDQLSFGLAYFETELDGLIEIPGGGMSPGTSINNREAIEITGWRLSLGWANNDISSQFSFNSKDIEQNGKDLGAVRRVAAATGDQFVWDTRWQTTQALQLGYTLNAVARLKDVPANQPERAGYVTHSLQAEYKLQQLEGLTLNLAVHNLFDKNYADHASLYSSSTGIVAEPGRDIRVAATYEF
ncbi:TonB-dependent receptor domain-containing protein [Marinospirillum insulare]|uniref:Ligand-gated channel protein n=1 Tax=Marinospirillum insulare TaxID=217169 RepID=A0ABQ5ZVL5_9GAMM|nr:TonB-dependent receptor [Marinospirillum insulare]GLR63075.1 ligand-gated channel protein [Marinospirillum insulare]